ncbi:hypothetical protein [Sulfurimonas sp.]|uniref:hypothetical protein n=1 Tax=Sulfurimonas sp. TaxID=2022749 RepID=UPI003D11AFCE
MADITMCINNTCPLRFKCYRQLAKPSDYQSYTAFIYDVEFGCNHFWDIKE